MSGVLQAGPLLLPRAGITLIAASIAARLALGHRADQVPAASPPPRGAVR